MSKRSLDKYLDIELHNERTLNKLSHNVEESQELLDLLYDGTESTKCIKIEKINPDDITPIKRVKKQINGFTVFINKK